MVSVLMAYTESKYLTDSFLDTFELHFKGNYERMNPEDIAKTYYCFTEAGFKGSGKFYKYLQKAFSKTLRAQDKHTLKYMMHKFEDEENTRLNRGIRRKILEVKERLEKKWLNNSWK